MKHRIITTMVEPVALHPAADAVVNDLAAAIAETLGDTLLALWVAGSLVVGDFDPDLSDIDLFAVTRAELDAEQVEALHAMHERLAAGHPNWHDRIEAVYFALPDLRAFRIAAPTFPRTSPGEPFHLRTDALIDWAQELSLLRTQSVTLQGPPAADLIPEVTRTEFVDNCLRYVRELAPRADTPLRASMESYLVLTACRALHALEVERQVSKRAAGLWLAATYPEWVPLIDLALMWRYTPSRTPRAASPCTTPFLRWVDDRISRAS